MPRFEILRLEQLPVDVVRELGFDPPQLRVVQPPKQTVMDIFLEALVAGKFDVLTNLQRVVVAFSYLMDRKLYCEEIGRFFDPPRSAVNISRIRADAWRSIFYYDLSRRQVDSLQLSTRIRNAIIRKYGDISPEQLINKPDEELLGVRNLWEKSLKELREKLAAHQPQPS